jgi:hypothetical protein
MRTRIRVVGFACLLVPFVLLAATPDRIRGPVDNANYTALPGTLHHMARAEYDQGPMQAEERDGGVSLDLQMTSAQQRDLETLLEQQRDPNSPNYHNWLTPDQFGERFGASPGDVAAVAAWLQSQGLTLEHVGAARNWILVGGTADHIVPPLSCRREESLRE